MSTVQRPQTKGWLTEEGRDGAERDFVTLLRGCAIYNVGTALFLGH